MKVSFHAVAAKLQLREPAGLARRTTQTGLYLERACMNLADHSSILFTKSADHVDNYSSAHFVLSSGPLLSFHSKKASEYI